PSGGEEPRRHHEDSADRQEDGQHRGVPLRPERDVGSDGDAHDFESTNPTDFAVAGRAPLESTRPVSARRLRAASMRSSFVHSSRMSADSQHTVPTTRMNTPAMPPEIR